MSEEPPRTNHEKAVEFLSQTVSKLGHLALDATGVVVERVQLFSSWVSTSVSNLRERNGQRMLNNSVDDLTESVRNEGEVRDIRTRALRDTGVIGDEHVERFSGRDRRRSEAAEYLRARGGDGDDEKAEEIEREGSTREDTPEPKRSWLELKIDELEKAEEIEREGSTREDTPEISRPSLLTLARDWRMDRKIGRYVESKVKAKKKRSARGHEIDTRQSKKERGRGKRSARKSFLRGELSATEARARRREAARTTVTREDASTSRAVRKKDRELSKVVGYSQTIERRAVKKTERAKKVRNRRLENQRRNSERAAQKREKHKELRRKIKGESEK